jgi:hypothetical protein
MAASQPVLSVAVAAPTELDGALKKMVDRAQRDSRLPNMGRSYCGPVSASNALTWFGENGFSTLKGEGEDGQLAMILELGKLMGTDPVKGTGPQGVAKGVKAYLEKRGVKFSMEFYGERKMPEGVCVVKGRDPTPEWLASMNDGKSVTLVHVGWYKDSPEGKGLVRSFGHWMAVIGAGKDKDGKADPMCLTVVDSGGGTTEAVWRKHTVRMVEAEEKLASGGKLLGKWKLEGEVERKDVKMVLLENVVGVRVGE